MAANLEGGEEHIHIMAATIMKHIPPALTQVEIMVVEQGAALAGAALAEEEYCNDKELTGFDAFSEEEVDDDESR